MSGLFAILMGALFWVPGLITLVLLLIALESDNMLAIVVGLGFGMAWFALAWYVEAMKPLLLVGAWPTMFATMIAMAAGSKKDTPDGAKSPDPKPRRFFHG